MSGHATCTFGLMRRSTRLHSASDQVRTRPILPPAFLLGLSSAEPEYVYANQEQRVKESPRSELTQEAIDTAFERAQRESKQILTYKWWRIRILNGRQTGQLGVVEIKGPSNERLLVTSTERH